MDKTRKLRQRRAGRARTKIKRITDRFRLSVFRSERHIYAQVIDDNAGVTLAAASSLEKDLRKQLKTGANRDAAAIVGKLVAQRALEKNVKEVVFDRNGNQYHGRVKALAEAARETGLLF